MKKQVQKEIFDDMTKYINDFQPDEYEICEKTEPRVISYVRHYYDRNLPVELNAWRRVNKEKLVSEQLDFIQDRIYQVLELSNDNPPLVVAIYYSKSVKLPVLKFDIKKYGAEMFIGYNFNSWKISIKSSKPLDIEPNGLFDPKEKIWGGDGFSDNRIYESYEQNHSQFSVEIKNFEKLYDFCLLLKNV